MQRVLFFSNLSHRSEAKTTMEQHVNAAIKSRVINIGFFHRQSKHNPVYETIKQKIATLQRTKQERPINVVFHSSCSVPSIIEHMEQLRKNLPGQNLVFYYYKKDDEYMSTVLSKTLRDYSEFKSSVMNKAA